MTLKHRLRICVEFWQGGANMEDYLRLWEEWEALQPHCTVGGWLRRCAVLHANKLVAIATCYAALHSPDFVGFLLMVSVSSLTL